MSQAPNGSRYSPPWFLIIGLVAGGGFLAFMLADSFPGKGKLAHSKNVIELTEANWQKEVVESATPVLVDFWGENCPPCVKLAPIVAKLADEYVGKIKVGKVNVNEQTKLAAKYRISGIPCVMIFDRSEVPSEAFEGLEPERVYVNAIKEVLAKKQETR